MPTRKKVVTKPSKITFHYTESMQHRVTHVDGALGSLTPQGLVAASFFSERFLIPTEMTHSLTGSTSFKAEPDEMKGKKGIVREIDVTAIFSPDIARRIAEWLITKADEADRLEQLKKPPHEGEK